MSNKMPENNQEKTGSALKKSSLIAGAVLILAAGVFAFGRQNQPVCETNPELQQTKIKTGDTELKTEVAASPGEKQQGLSDRACLGQDSAMLFNYDTPGDYCFWMKDMNFAIDMIWLDQDKKVVYIKDKVTPDTYPNVFCSDEPAQYIVETSSGLAAESGWTDGTKFDF